MSASDRWGQVTFPALYYIHTFSAFEKADRVVLYRTCMATVLGGCRLIQLRYKGPWSGLIAGEIANVLQDFEGSDARFVMNDRAEWAQMVRAHGVHVGEAGDTPVAAARVALGRGALIGATTKTDEQLTAALAGGADYVSYGALFESETKPEAIPGTLEHLPVLKARLPEHVKLCVIGGITLERIPKVMRSGVVDMVAVGGAIQRAADPELETIKLIEAMRAV